MALLGAVIGGALGLLGAKKGADAQKDAAKDQLEMSKYMFDTNNDLAKNALSSSRKLFRNSNDRVNDLIDGYGSSERSRLANTRNFNTNTINDMYGASSAALTAGRDGALGALNPYTGAGENALSAYLYNMGIGDRPDGYAGLELSEGAQYLLNEGRRNVEGAAAATGGLYSGNTLAEMERMRAGTVAMDRDNQMNALLNIIGVGSGAASQAAGINTAYGNSMAGLEGATANALMANRGAYTDAANAISADKLGMRLGQEGVFTNQMATAIADRANAGTNATTNYAAMSNNALANLGDAGAAAWTSGTNAVNNAINNWQISNMLNSQPTTPTTPIPAATPFTY